TGPALSLLGPEGGGEDFPFGAPSPPLGGPPALCVVAAVLDELRVCGVGDGTGVDPVPVQVHLLCGLFVVEGPGVVVGTERERARRNVRLVGGRWTQQCDGVDLLQQDRGSPAQLVGCEHGFVVHVFVLDDHVEHKTVIEQGAACAVDGPARCGNGRAEVDTVEYVQHLAAYPLVVLVGLGRVEQGQSDALVSRILECVVETVDVGAQCLASSRGTQKPLFLAVADVGQVPDQGGHQWRALGLESVVVQGVECEPVAAAAAASEFCGDAFLDSLLVGVHRATPRAAMWRSAGPSVRAGRGAGTRGVSAGLLPRRVYWSA